MIYFCLKIKSRKEPLMSSAPAKIDPAIGTRKELSDARQGDLRTALSNRHPRRGSNVAQNPREVATKFGKRIDTFFAKDFVEVEAPLREWMTYLDEVALYSPDDPLFPATALTTQSNKGFRASGFTRAHWKTTEPVRKVVNTAFETAGLPAYGPHAFRHMLARHAAKNCKTVAEFVATAQNLGHADPLTTLRSYGQISRDDQRRLITGEDA
jgi:hypothetical protein